MQVFLPVADLDASAQMLGPMHLSNQINEALIIHRTITGQSNAWPRHTAVTMWRGHPQALAAYAAACCREQHRRTGRGLCRLAPFRPWLVADPRMPDWFGYDLLHAAYRSQLVHKAPAWYGRFGWRVPTKLMPYVWPNDPYAAVRGVGCPRCGAEAGFSCVTSAGKPSSFHGARRKAEAASNN